MQRTWQKLSSSQRHNLYSKESAITIKYKKLYEKNEIIITQMCTGVGSRTFASQEETTAKALESGLNFISEGKLSKEEMASYLEKSKLPKSKASFAKVDVSALDEYASLSIFRLPVLACSGACEVKSGDKVLLIYPPMCLDDFDRCCLSPQHIVAIKFDDSFVSAIAGELYLANTAYKYVKEDKVNCPASFEDLLWENLKEDEYEFTDLIEFVLVKLI